MPQDDPAPVESVSGPRKRTLTEKAKEAALNQSTKRVRPAAPAPSRVHSKAKASTSSKVSTPGPCDEYTHRWHSGSSISSFLNLLYLLPHLLETDDDIGNDNDSVMLSASRGTSPRGTSPVESSHTGNTEVVYEVEDSDDDEVPESAEAELSTQRPFNRNMLLTSYQNGLAKTGPRRSTSSSIVCPVSNTSKGAESTSSCVRPPTARGRMAVMCAASWTLAMRSQQVVFIGTQRCVGARRRLMPRPIQKICKARARSWPSLG